MSSFSLLAIFIVRKNITSFAVKEKIETHSAYGGTKAASLSPIIENRPENPMKNPVVPKSTDRINSDRASAFCADRRYCFSLRLSIEPIRTIKDEKMSAQECIPSDSRAWELVTLPTESLTAAKTESTATDTADIFFGLRADAFFI